MRAPPSVIMREPNTASASPAMSGARRLGQALRRVLAVAVDQRDEIKPVLDGVAVAEFLVAAVTLVFGVAQDGNLEAAVVVMGPDVVEAGVEGVVRRGVVDDEDFDVFGRRRRRGDAVEHPGERRFRVVGDDENQDARRGERSGSVWSVVIHRGPFRFGVVKLIQS